jgi:hypothetical protein
VAARTSESSASGSGHPVGGPDGVTLSTILGLGFWCLKGPTSIIGSGVPFFVQSCVLMRELEGRPMVLVLFFFSWR